MSTGSSGGRKPKWASIEWPTVLLILACYAGWIAIGLVVWPQYPIIAVTALGVVIALQSSLMHEASHGHPTRSGRVNEWLVGLPIGLVYPFRRFRTLHLRHHADERLTDPFDDPESYYQAIWHHERLPKLLRMLLKANNTMVGRFFIGPWLGSAGFVGADFQLLGQGDAAVRKAWLIHGVSLMPVLAIVVFVFEMPIWIYVLGPIWIGQAIMQIRTFAEHQWSERPDGRTIIVERSPLSFLFLNNNLHLVHHKSPNVAWYRLPAIFRARREEWVRMNDGYVFPNYFALLKSFAFRAKEPVVHPFLRRSPEPGRAFRPRMRGRSLTGMATTPIPAEPPKE